MKSELLNEEIDTAIEGWITETQTLKLRLKISIALVIGLLILLTYSFNQNGKLKGRVDNFEKSNKELLNNIIQP